MDKTLNSEVEKTNLEVHVDMERQRFSMLSEKVETLDERMDAVINELSEFRKEHALNMQALREESASQTHGTNKLFVGAASTVIAGLLSTVVLLLVAII